MTITLAGDHQSASYSLFKRVPGVDSSRLGGKGQVVISELQLGSPESERWGASSGSVMEYSIGQETETGANHKSPA